MLALRCIVGDVRVGGRLLRALPPSLPQRRVLSRGGGPSPPSPGPRLRTRLAVALALGGGLLAAWRLVHGEKQQQLQRQRVEQLQKAALGRGAFSLVDHTGRRRTKADFLGSWVGQT
ncbi:protein SCO2 homolog, mitochondrial-like, partial [Etheostoma cragini]|uniref:protein SCO2 homolog, mitochondrial-like n=1 Tax=Etheostoma cragini TaxID=417921 RepID=UPI00155E13B9